jgi:hypothetical protein
VQTGVPDETEPEPVAAGEAADDAALVAEAPALAAPADDVVEAAAGEAAPRGKDARREQRNGNQRILHKIS